MGDCEGKGLSGWGEKRARGRGEIPTENVSIFGDDLGLKNKKGGWGGGGSQILSKKF